MLIQVELVANHSLIVRAPLILATELQINLLPSKVPPVIRDVPLKFTGCICVRIVLPKEYLSVSVCK